ncbi:hypothetical protein L6452_22730 [Arctium lappa]|uniref:Uncharacterized protein n=1 Tax=Arctium lappa TaxID=4217 RepID=A0ACB9B2B9_ARCLA|nr:hypothetical protein L6452_22730 [Arctium lappa]
MKSVWQQRVLMHLAARASQMQMVLSSEVEQIFLQKVTFDSDFLPPLTMPEWVDSKSGEPHLEVYLKKMECVEVMKVHYRGVRRRPLGKNKVILNYPRGDWNSTRSETVSISTVAGKEREMGLREPRLDGIRRLLPFPPH